MSLHFLIDGYNVIHAMPDLAERTLEAARTGFLTFLGAQRPQGSARNAVTVVFDGRDDVFWPEPPGEIRVLFSRAESADDLIKRLIEDEVNPRGLVLVSNDRDLQQCARQHGGTVMAAETFIARGESARRSAAVRKTASVRAADGKVISEVFRARVNREFEDIWLKPRE